MKLKLLSLLGAFSVAANAGAAPVSLVEVGAPSINCFFSPTCTLQVSDSTAPIMLPGTRGTGALQTRVFVGETNSLGAGLFGYEYRIDLTGVISTSSVPCFTNVARCFTNRVVSGTNVVTCRTNVVGGTNRIVCTTNRFAFTNLVACYTNLIPCPGFTPCIETLRIPFGAIYQGVSFDTGSVATAQAYVVTSGGLGTIEPVFAETIGSHLVIQFARPVCPGESSFFIGVVSTNPPTDVTARLTTTGGSNVLVATRAPTRAAINCDLGPLENAVTNLALSDIVAPNDNARAGRRGALWNHLEAAQEAAAAGELEDLISAVRGLENKVSRERNGWLTARASARLQPILDDLLRCLEEAAGDSGIENGKDDGKDDDVDGGGNNRPPFPSLGNPPPGRSGNPGERNGNGPGNRKG